jgi:hypothetical protein
MKTRGKITLRHSVSKNRLKKRKPSDLILPKEIEDMIDREGMARVIAKNILSSGQLQFKPRTQSRKP